MRFLFLLILFPLTNRAQSPGSQQQFASGITAADLQKHLYIIAGPEMEGRNTASVGEQRAAAYIINHFKQIGVLPGNKGNYLQSFPVYRDTITRASIEVNNQIFEWGKDFSTPRSTHSATMFFSEAVYVNAKISDTSFKIDLKGKLAIVSNAEARYYAHVKEAAAILFVFDKFIPSRENIIHNSGIYYERALPLTYFISGSVAESIMGKQYADSINSPSFKSDTYKVKIKLDLQKQSDQVPANNVIGIVEGTDKKDEYLFITAHYDHLGKYGTEISYGADDDGSGTVSVLEIAEAFAKAKSTGNGPRRTVVFMLVSGEEKGLWGSEYYTEHPVFPLKRTTADLNIDMVGRIDPEYKGDSLNYVYAIGEDKLSSDLVKITDRVNKKYAKIKIDRRFNDPNDPNAFYYRSDHYNFAKKGVPIIFYFNGVHADYHKTTDTPDKINYQLMAKRVKLIFHTAWEMANRDEILKRDIPLK